MNKEQKKPQEDIWKEYGIAHNSEIGVVVYPLSSLRMGTVFKDQVRLKDFIRTNFIAKRDLRKLLEEVVAKFHDGFS